MKIAVLIRKLDGHQSAGWPRDRAYWTGWLSWQHGDSTDYCSYNHNGLQFRLGKWANILPNWPAMCRLAARYTRFAKWIREGRHQWTEVRRINYADNSVDVVEKSRLTGEERHRNILAPGGDLCFYWHSPPLA